MLSFPRCKNGLLIWLHPLPIYLLPHLTLEIYVLLQLRINFKRQPRLIERLIGPLLNRKITTLRCHPRHDDGLRFVPMDMFFLLCYYFIDIKWTKFISKSHFWNGLLYSFLVRLHFRFYSPPVLQVYIYIYRYDTYIWLF